MSLHETAIPTFQKGFQSLLQCLDKAQAHGLSDDAILSARLIDDMWPLSRQINSMLIPTTLKRICKIDESRVPTYDSPPASIAEARERVAIVQKLLSEVKPEAFATGSEKVHFKWFVAPQELEEKDYVASFAMPNFYFHWSMVYAILRKEGVPVGKSDFVILGEETRVEGEGY